MSSTSTRSELMEKMRAAVFQLNYEQLCKARDFVTALEKAEQMVADLKKSEEKDQHSVPCANCEKVCHENVHIYCLQRGAEEEVWCSECVHDNWRYLKEECWEPSDMDTWADMGFVEEETEKAEDKDIAQVEAFQAVMNARKIPEQEWESGGYWKSYQLGSGC